MTVYFSNASQAARVAPLELPGTIAVLATPNDPVPIGVAHEAGYVGGRRGDDHPGPLEPLWSLVIGGEPVTGRFVLRAGRFVQLAEGAR
jgi:hypothetical protein